MKLLHTSDWHIGRSLFEFSLLDDQKQIFEQIYSIIETEKPDAVLVSGDLYDRSLPAAQAVELLDQVLTTIITRFHIPVLAISGNHDSAKRIDYGSRLFEENGLYLAGNFSPRLKKVTLYDELGPVHFFLLPYFFPQQVRLAFDIQNDECRTSSEAFRRILLENEDIIPKEERCVLLAHGFFMNLHRQKEAPTTCQSETMVGTSDLTDLSCADCFDYVALGHLHTAQSAGAQNMRYSGSPLKYSVDEAKGQKSVTIVELAQKDQVTYRQIPLNPPHDLRVISGPIEELCRPELASDDYIFAHIVSHGPVLNAMSRLREVYPNTLGLSFDEFILKEGTLPANKTASLPPDELFCRFYQQNTDTPLSESEKELVRDIFAKLAHEEDLPQKEDAR